MTMIIEPEPSGEDHVQWSEANRPSKSNDGVEDGDDFGKDKCEYHNEGHRPEPDGPVDKCALLKVVGVSQDPHEYIFSGHLHYMVSTSKNESTS